MFQPNLKSKLLHPFSIVTSLLKHVLFLQLYRPLLLATQKNVLPAHYHNNVIYQFVGHCDSRYVERTSQRFQEHIKQQVLRPFRNHHPSQERSNFSRASKTNSNSPFITHDSAIGQHLFWETLPAPANTVTPKSLSFFEDILLSAFPLFKLLLSNFFNLIKCISRQEIFLQSKIHSLTLFFFLF